MKRVIFMLWIIGLIILILTISNTISNSLIMLIIVLVATGCVVAVNITLHTLIGRTKYTQHIQSDGYGDLYRREVFDSDPLVTVKVVNPTPEPDGTYEDFVIRVPPEVETAEEAVAWTFGMDKDEYNPEIET